MTTIPLITQPLEDLVVAENAANTTLDLFQHFDDPFTTGQIARFVLYNRSLGNGITDVVLFDQADAGAPKTVENFINYVKDDDYINSIVHRSIPNFVIQGGGFTVENLAIEPIPTDPSVVNEFSAERSNVRGTIAMAKLGSDPDSATSQWFFNLADNSANLDKQNGGFTVFGEVLNETNLATVDAIAELPVFNGSNFFGQPALTNLPLDLEDSDSPTIDEDSDLVRYSNITLRQEAELEFEVISNSNPNLVNAAIAEGQLTLDYAEGSTGEAEIEIKATDLLGDSVEEKFVVRVGDSETTPKRGSTVYRFLNRDTGTHLYTTSEVERRSILNNLPNYVSEGESYVSVDPLSGDPDPETVYRFLNRDTGTHLYTTSEVEKEFVEENLSNFSRESESFDAYEVQQPGTIPIYRFYNTQTGAHFYTPSVVERDFVRENLLNYNSEGIAYYAFGISE